MERGATPAELAFALAAFTKLKTQHRSLKALARERARTIASLQSQLDKREDADSPSLRLAEQSATQFLNVNRELRVKAEKALASARAELVVLRHEAEEQRQKHRDYTDELRLVIKGLKSEVLRERDAQRRAVSQKKMATARMDLLQEENADFSAKAQRAEARVEQLGTNAAQQHEKIANLQEELSDLRNDHRMLLEERLSEREVFCSETETMAEEVLNLQHENKLLQDKIVSVQLIADTRVSQAIHMERDRAERELADKLNLIKREDAVALKAVADQLSEAKVKVLALESSSPTPRKVEEKEKQNTKKTNTSRGKKYPGRGIPKEEEEDEVEEEKKEEEEQEGKVSDEPERGKIQQKKTGAIASPSPYSAKAGIFTPPHMQTVSTPSLSSASLSFNMLSSLKSPASAAKSLSDSPRASNLSFDNSPRSYEQNYRRAIEDLRTLDGLTSSGNMSQLLELASKLKQRSKN